LIALEDGRLAAIETGRQDAALYGRRDARRYAIFGIEVAVFLSVDRISPPLFDVKRGS
jgi:hypothetical protein